MENSEGLPINLPPKLELNLNNTVRQELGPQNLENLNSFSQALKTKSNELGLEPHLVLVGGNINPEKKRKNTQRHRFSFVRRRLYSQLFYPSKQYQI